MESEAPPPTRPSPPAGSRSAPRRTWRLNRGQPSRGARLYDEAIGAERPATALDALFWDEARERWVDATFLVAEAAIARGDTSHVAGALLRLRAVPPTDSLPVLTAIPRWYAILLDAQLAAVTHRPDSAARLTSLDSLLRLGPDNLTLRAVGNLVVARLWEQRGDLTRARAALLRTNRGPVPTPFASTYLRERARVAAALGDTDAAIRDYRRYLGARAEAEPALAAHLASVRAELARLEREGGR